MGWKPRNATCHPDRKHYAKGLCKICYEGSNRTRKGERQPVMATCHPDRKHKGHGLCNACYQATPERREAAKRRTDSQHYYRRKHLWTTYRMTLDEYDRLLAEQGGVCAICGNPPKGDTSNLDVDHDHTTGVTRGLLCRGCNIHLSSAERNGWVESCMAYLAKHNHHSVSMTT